MKVKEGWGEKVTFMALLLGLGSMTTPVQAADLARYYVPMNATASTSPTARIALNWTADAFATNWVVYRRNADAVGGTGDWTVTNAADTGSSYTDTNVSPGAAYEYCVVKNGDEGTNFYGSGYILAGLEAPLIESRGKLVLMVDNSFSDSLAPELSRLVNDLEGDGWEVLRHDVDKSLTAPQIKAIIRAEYDADTNHVKSVFLFGRLAVPYSGSGTYAAVTHSTDTKGAQPTDLYYGDMSGLDGLDWTDTNTETTASIYKHHNIPGDGKFDQAFVPGDGPTNRPGPSEGIIELEVGRVDLSDMPAFKVSETELLRRYLTKDHSFRHKKFVPLSRALMMADGSTPCQDAYRNFTPMVGLANIFSTGMYVPSLADPDPLVSSYLWAGGFGNGQRECIVGIVTSTDHANNTLNAVFTMGFSSYWHDYDVENSLYRAPLAGEGTTLVRLYARGVWFLHEMGLGRNIGSSVRRSQSQDWERVPLYSEPIFFSGKISVYSLMSITQGSLYQSLMGDPTLRASYVAPPTNVTVSGAVISWGAPAGETVAGYHVYRQDGGPGAFNRLDHVGTSSLVTGLSFTDPSPYGGQSVYMVRAVKLESGPSGSFYNPSQGITVAYPAQLVQLAEVTDGTPSAPRALESGTYQNLRAAPPPASGGPYVCTWTGTGSVPSGGKGSNVTVLLDQASTVSWSWTTNHDSVLSVLSPVQGGVYQPGSNVVIKVTGFDGDGQIAKVEFLDENQNLLPGTYNTGNRNVHNPNPATSAYYDWVWDGNGGYFAGWYVDSALGRLYKSNQPYIGEYRYTWSAPSTGNHAVTVKATDVNGGVTVLPPVSFTVGNPTAPLTLEEQPASQAVDVGQRAVFSVAVSGGTLPYSYVWKWNTTALSGGWGDSYTAFPATPKHHYIATYDANNGATYSVVVTDALNNSVTSAVAVLTVNVPPPTIVTPPLGQTVLDGQTATFTVGVSAVVPDSGLLYQWQKQVPAGSWAAISLATNATYSSAVTTNDNGNYYRVTVSHKTDWNGDGYLPGSVTSSAALLTVTTNFVAPAIAAQPANQTVNVGQSATFSVTASGSAPLYYQWRTNGVDINGATASSHTTAATVTNDSGTLYSVVVSNTLGVVTSANAMLTVVLVAPAISAQPGNQTVTAGQTATFSVTASGTSPLFYQWRTNGTAIAGATASSHTTAATVTNDSGTLYSVVVSNVAGSVTSLNALLTVTAAPVVPAITTQPTNQAVTAGQTAAFGVAASGTAPLYYQWRTNGIAISGATSASHTTAATVAGDSGKAYSVVVSNAAGSVTSVTATLTVNAAPIVYGVPFSDSFEPYAPGLSVVGTNGWTGATGAGIVTALTYAVGYPPGYPIPRATHSRVLHVDKSLQNRLFAPSNQNVGVDFMLQATNGVLPAAPTNAVQFGLGVNTQGVVQVWHFFDNGGTWTRRWTALGNSPVGPGQWVRVSVEFDYTNNAAGHTLFRPALDGVAYPTAYGVAAPTNLAAPGPWYVCADSPAAGGGGARKISVFNIEDDRPCRIDDFVVTIGELAHTQPGSLLMIQ